MIQNLFEEAPRCCSGCQLSPSDFLNTSGARVSSLTFTAGGWIAPSPSLTNYGSGTPQLETMVTGVVRGQFARGRRQNEIPVLHRPRPAAAFELWKSTHRLFLMDHPNGHAGLPQVHLGLPPLSRPPDGPMEAGHTGRTLRGTV